MAYKLSAWDLSELKTADFKKTLEEIKNKTDSFAAKRERLTNDISADEFMGLVKELEDLNREASKFIDYFELKFTEDSTDQEAAAKKAEIGTALTKMGNNLIFFNLWFKQLPEAKAKELITASGKYHYHFESSRRLKKYALKENEEKIINIKDLTGSSAMSDIYDILTSQFEYEVDGKKYQQEELVSLVRDPNPETREKAYKALLGKYSEYKNVTGEIYRNIVTDWREECVGLRGYKNPISVRDESNDLPQKAVEALLKVSEKNQHLFHRFFEMKRKALGLEKLRRFDIYAPLSESKEKISYDDAVNMVLDSFGKFSKEFKAGALKIIEGKHVHSTVKKGKRSGAFCATTSTDVDPYVLLSYTGTMRDVSTLAHELGHGIHSILAQGQTEFTHHSCLPLAETASIFSEMILSEKLMEKYPNKVKEMLFAKLDEIYASIIRQSGFVMFEKKAHNMIEEGATIQQLSDTYIADLRKQLGDKIEVDDVFQYEWTYIPHIFHTPFYCYAYSFGNLLVLGLWEMYKEEGESFVPKLIDMLSKGGSEEPVQVAKAVGVDICSEEFWQKGFDVIEQMIERLEKIE